MYIRPPKSPLRLLWPRRQRMLAEDADLRSWWWQRGSGTLQPKLNIAYQRHAPRMGDPEELKTFLLDEMRRRGWWEYPEYVAARDAELDAFNDSQAEKRERASQDAANPPAQKEEKGGILGAIGAVLVLIALVYGLFFTDRPSCGRYDDCERYSDSVRDR